MVLRIKFPTYSHSMMLKYALFILIFTSRSSHIKPFSFKQKHNFYYTIIIIIIGIQPLGRFRQRPELSQSTGITLVRCILGKFFMGSLLLLSPAFRRHI